MKNSQKFSSQTEQATVGAIAFTYNQEFRRRCRASPRIQPRGKRSTQSKIQFAATENANDLNIDSIGRAVPVGPVLHSIHDTFQIVHAPFDNQPTLKPNIEFKSDLNSLSMEIMVEYGASTYHR